MSELATAFGWSRDIPDRLAEHGLLTRDGPGSPDNRRRAVSPPDPAEPLGKAFIVDYSLSSEMALNTTSAPRSEARFISSCSVRSTRSASRVRKRARGPRRAALRASQRLPQVVLREAVANALARRSCECQGTSIRIELYPQLARIVFSRWSARACDSQEHEGDAGRQEPPRNHTSASPRLGRGCRARCRCHGRLDARGDARPACLRGLGPLRLCHSPPFGAPVTPSERAWGS